MSIYSTPIATLNGQPNALAAADGKVTLVVNVASKCGLTPQYEQLELLQKAYAEKGFTVLECLAINSWDKNLVHLKKSQVSAAQHMASHFHSQKKSMSTAMHRHPLYEALTPVADAEGVNGDIRWNFEKFLVGRDGKIVARFSPMVLPDAPEVVAAIESAL